MWQATEEFVKKICGERDVSHDFKHMEMVVANSLKICDIMQITDPDTLTLVKMCAYLHDVDDHKYESRSKELNDFLQSLNLSETFGQDVLQVIQNISFSKEKKLFQGKTRNWTTILPERLVIVRNIVSDADKLEALSKIGIDRCLQYAYHLNPQITTRQSLERIIVHADEKLYNLIDYFTTEAGLTLAKPLDREMRMILDSIASMLKYTV